jgi:hypothetical protein
MIESNQKLLFKDIAYYKSLKIDLLFFKQLYNKVHNQTDILKRWPLRSTPTEFRKFKNET